MINEAIQKGPDATRIERDKEIVDNQDSKKQILKSTGILGFVQVVSIVIGIIRVKVLAVLLGPAGVGLAGIYQTTITLVGSVTNLGLNFSGVREMAAAVETGDAQKLAQTAMVLKRWAWFTGILGALVTVLLCRPLSRLAFGNESYAWGLAILSVGLFSSAVTAGMTALLQGMRRVVDMAKANVMGALLGLVTASAIYYFFGLEGIVPALLATFLISHLVTWVYVRKIKQATVSVSAKETYEQGLSMARLGAYMVITALSGNATMYLVRAFIVQQGGLESVGHFVAAWTITTMYTSAIFNAMGADYYPRLSAVQHNNQALAKMVNEQTEVALLLIVPIIIAMISMVGLVVPLFYSHDFSETAEILNWQLLGDFFKVLAWPMGYVLMAKGKGKVFLLTETVWNLLFIGFVYFGWSYFGIKASGIGFLVAYIFNLSAIFLILNKMTGFKWSADMGRYSAFFMLLLVLAFSSAHYFANQWQGYAIGTVLTAAATAFSFMHLRRLVDVSGILQKIKGKFSSN